VQGLTANFQNEITGTPVRVMPDNDKSAEVDDLLGDLRSSTVPPRSIQKYSDMRHK